MEDYVFESLPDSLILSVLNYLSPFDVARIGQTSQRFKQISSDEILWKRLFHRYFCLQPAFPNPIGYDTWRAEFVRLIDEIPIIESQVLRDHSDQVLHVAHSHNGQIFATTSKDAYVHVWNSSTHPVTLKYSYDMKRFSWKYTQFSQFNESDTLLLVSGVLFGMQSTSGEIVIFSVKDEFALQCRVQNKPYDIFGTWYSEKYLFSGDLVWLGHLVSKSIIWLNKASQETESEHTAITNMFYKFYNPKASSVRSILVANCVTVDDDTGSDATAGGGTSARGVEDEQRPTSSKYVNWQTSGNPPSICSVHAYCDGDDDGQLLLPRESDLISINSRGTRGTLQGAFQNWKPLNNIADINYAPEYRSVAQHNNNNKGGVDEEGRRARALGQLSPKRFKSMEEAEAEEEEDEVDMSEEDGSGSASASANGSSPHPPQQMDEDEEFGVVEIRSAPSTSPAAARAIHPRICANIRHSLAAAESIDVNRLKSRTTTEEVESAAGDDEEEEIIDPREKWLIFTCGSKTYTPHQIGFKKIKPFKFKSRIELGPSLVERYQELKRREEAGLAPGGQGQGQGDQVDYTNWNAVASRFDVVDHVIDLHGHIIGMTLSPDHRYLYVNSRPWPGNYTISVPMEPPPIAQEIDIHVIDLTTLRQVGMMRRAHRAYTPNEECFFIFLDASDYYLGSGAEDRHAYLWERLYGLSLTKLPHSDVVNSVAFNPSNPEMLISVSDDHTIKIWRSRRQCRELGLKTESLTKGLKLYLTPRPTYANTHKM